MKEKKRSMIFKSTGLLILISLLVLSFNFSCTKYQFEPPTVDPGEEVSFQEDILTIFEDNNCAACHPSNSPPDLTSANAYESLQDGYINLEVPEESEIYSQFEGGHAGLDTGSIELQKILNWIIQGAENN